MDAALHGVQLKGKEKAKVTLDKDKKQQLEDEIQKRFLKGVK